MNAIYLIGFVALATFFLCEGQNSPASVNVVGLNLRERREIAAGQEIKIFLSPGSNNDGHLFGSIGFVDNQIVIQEPGLYFFYATLRLHGYEQRYTLTINSRDVLFGVPVGSGGTSVSGTYCVQQGDKIGLRAYDNVDLWLESTRDNFGAFKLNGTETC